MRVLIIGGGGVGSVLAGYLARSGRNVTVADGWFANVETIRHRGLTVEAVEGHFVAHPRAIHLEELAEFGQADVIVIAGKSYDTRMLTLLAREHLHSDTIVMSAQNGMNDASVAETVGEERVVACVVALGADLIDAGRVRRSSAEDAPSIVIGHLAPGRSGAVIEALGELFSPLGGVKLVDDAWPERWGKLTLNSMSNALAGLTGLWSDRMWSESLTLDVIIALGHETAMLAAAEGVSASPVLGRISQPLLISADSVVGEAWAEVVAIMRVISAERVGKKANRASLLQDIMRGRRTEIDHLNGWIVRRARELGMSAPTHERIVLELKSVEAGARPPALDNARPLAQAVRAWYP